VRALMRAIDKFSLTHRRFGIRRLMLYIVIGYAAYYVIAQMDLSGMFLYWTYFDPSLILKGQVWRLVSWIFYPSSGPIFFLVLMLYFTYFIGTSLEQEWGTPKFTIYYLLSVLFNIIYGFAVWFISGTRVFLVSDYMNLSLLLAFATLFPNQTFMIFFVIPLKVKWLALIDAVFFMYAIVADLIAGWYFNAFLPVVAVLNFLIFCYDDLMHYLRPYRTASTKQAINFRKAARRKRHEEAAHPYRHKCAVCGKTDAGFPSLEFRYCSRCSGYHCFCIDHINNHVHFQ